MRVLIEMGADVNARAALDARGLNGHTPLFHTVNSAWNRSAPIMEALLDGGAAADVRLAGITWGRGFEWETTLFDVTPISYAQFGLLPQVHRDERDMGADRATIDRIIAPDWKSTAPDGRMSDRAAVFADVFETRRHKIRRVEIDDVTARVFGDAAVVTGRTHGRGEFDGSAYDVVIRFTDTFVRRDGRWQAVASHASVLAGGR